MDRQQLVIAPLIEDPPPRHFQWYTWAQHIDPNHKRATPRFRDDLRDLLPAARERHQDATGHPARFLSLRQPTAILGPRWRCDVTGNYGAFDNLIVLRDPKLGPSEFGLAY